MLYNSIRPLACTHQPSLFPVLLLPLDLLHDVDMWHLGPEH